jgi:hypothetical protein
MSDDLSIRGGAPLPGNRPEDYSKKGAEQKSEIEKAIAFNQQANQVVDAMNNIIMILRNSNQNVETQDRAIDQKSLIKADLMKIVSNQSMQQSIMPATYASSHLSRVTDALDQIKSTASIQINQLQSNQKLSPKDFEKMYSDLLTGYENLKTVANSFSPEEMKKLDPIEQMALKDVREKMNNYASGSIDALSLMSKKAPDATFSSMSVAPESKSLRGRAAPLNFSVPIEKRNKLGIPNSTLFKNQVIANRPMPVQGQVQNPFTNPQMPLKGRVQNTALPIPTRSPISFKQPFLGKISSPVKRMIEIEAMKNQIMKPGVLTPEEQARLSLESAKNQLGNVQPVKSEAKTAIISSGKLWNAIKNVVCGSAFYVFLNRLSIARTKLSMQNKGLSILNKMLQQFGANFNVTGNGAWNMGGVIPNKQNATQWRRFLSQLSNLHRAMGPVQTRTVSRKVRSKYMLPPGQKATVTVTETLGGQKFKTTVQVNYKFKTRIVRSQIRSGGKFNLMYDSLKRKIAYLKQDARKVITTPKGGKSTINLRSLLSMANNLSNKLVKFKAAAQAMNNARVPGGVNVDSKNLKLILSNFQKYAQSFANSLKGNVSNLQNVSAESGNKLKLELSIYQQYLQTASSLIQILSDLAKSVARNVKGGSG